MNPDQLQQRLESLGSQLTPTQCTEFRTILHEIAKLHSVVTDIFKYAELTLIPSKVTPNKEGFYGTVMDDDTRVDPRSVLPTFTPTIKPRETKGDPLAELAAQMSPGDREKLIAAMESKEKK